MPRRKPRSDSKPLWTCPRCRRQFKNRNQSHSCGQFTVEQHLEGVPDEVVALYDRLREIIDRCGPVIVAPTKTRILFKIRTVFATVTINKKWLDLVFVLDRRLKHRRIKKSQAEYPGIVHFLRIETQDEFDEELASWIREAFEHRLRKDQGAGD